MPPTAVVNGPPFGGVDARERKRFKRGMQGLRRLERVTQAELRNGSSAGSMNIMKCYRS